MHENLKKEIPYKKLIITGFFAVFFLVSGIISALQYNHFKSLEIQNIKLQHNIQAADILDNPRKAVNRYKQIIPLIPEVRLRILQQQWLIGQEMLNQIQAVRNNTILKNDLPHLLNSLKIHLNEMELMCNDLINENQLLQKHIRWRGFNMRGAVRLLTAYIVLETEKNEKKTTAMIKETVSDFKSAIYYVDKAYFSHSQAISRSQAPAWERAIPRWNMELLHSKQYIRKMALTEPDTAQRLDIRENLEAVIPEKGGYAPGEPMERKIEK